MMRKSAKVLSLVVLMGLLISLGVVPSADAALKAAGPVSPVTTLPTFYQDTNSLALGLCLDQNFFCVLTPAFDPLLTNPPSPITTVGPISDLNFPNEIFYFLADVLMNVGPDLAAKFRLRLAMEGAFLAGVVPNQGTTFLRINSNRIAAGLTPNSTFTVTHPYGTFTFSSDGTGASVLGLAGQTFRTQDPLAAAPGIYFPPDLQAATTTGIGPFLVASGGLVTDPVTGNRYIGNPGAPTTATVGIGGLPASVTITGPNIGGTGVNTISTTLFALSGKIIGLDVQPGTNLNLGSTNIVTANTLGTVLVPQTVTVTNTTGTPITFGALVPTPGPDAADFIITSPPAAGGVGCANLTGLIPADPAVAGSGVCSFDITFKPAAVARSARSATLALAPTAVGVGVSNPPPVTLNLTGTALVDVTMAAAGHGTVTPAPGTTAEPAGSTVTIAVTPESKKFKVKEVTDGVTLLGAAPPAATPNLPRTPPFTLPVGFTNHTVTATFMPSGDLDSNGTLDVADAQKALRIVAGFQKADTDDPDNTAVKVAPLAGGKPAPDAARIAPNIGDVLVILRRVVGVDTW